MIERDVIDWLVAIFTITTGLVLAMAAVLAFVVQRARYRHEIEPDLRFTRCWANSPPIIENGELVLTIHTNVDNRSAYRAHNLKLSGTLSLAPSTSNPPVLLRDKPYREWHQASRSAELASGERTEMAIQMVSSTHSEASLIDTIKSLTGIVHFGSLVLEYESEADIAHRFLNAGRKRFSYQRIRSLAVTLEGPRPRGSANPDPSLIHSPSDVRIDISLTGTTLSSE